MRKVRDVFYINACRENSEVTCYGLEMAEFIRYAPVRPRGILLLKAEYYGVKSRTVASLETVSEEEMPDFLREDIYGYGDFCWVDYDQADHVDSLAPMEIAELLYLGYTFGPLRSPFFETIQNRYAYLAHDDGWYTRLFLREYGDFQEIISNKTAAMLSTSRRKIHPFPDALKERLMQLAQNGLVIDYGHLRRDRGSMEIPVHTIGKFTNMDDMYNDLMRYISRARFSARLLYRNKQWSMDVIKEE